jgi:hypothetical protein
MVVNRPVVGVRNPVRSASPYSYFRAKKAGTGSPESGDKPHPRNPHLFLAMTSATTSEPGSKLLEAATHTQNQIA